jgi:cytochrome b involved in lipid metabolism
MWELNPAKGRDNIKSYKTGFTLLCPPSSRQFPLSLRIPLLMATKVITLDELREHTTKENIWVLIHGKGQFPRHQWVIEVSDDLP